jgi:hypothetical protein
MNTATGQLASNWATSLVNALTPPADAPIVTIWYPGVTPGEQFQYGNVQRQFAESRHLGMSLINSPLLMLD